MQTEVRHVIYINCLQMAEKLILLTTKHDLVINVETYNNIRLLAIFRFSDVGTVHVVIKN